MKTASLLSRINPKALISYAIFVLVMGTDALLTPHFFSEFDLETLFSGALPLLLVSVGQFFVVITGGIDLSVGGVVSIVNTLVAVTLVRGAGSLVEVVLLSIVVGLAAGLLNGIVIAYARIQPILVTLATLSIYSGLALLILPAPGGSVPSGFSSFLSGQLLAVPIALWAVILLIAFWLWLRRTPVWAHIVSVGSDENAAQMNGIDVRLNKVMVYMASGFLSAMAGVYLSSQTGSGDPTSGGQFVILSIAAVAIGGISLAGGRGTLFGAVIGGLIVSVLNSLLFFVGVPSYFQNFVQGAILLLTVGFISYRSLRVRILNRQIG